MSEFTLQTVGTVIKKEDLRSVESETYSNHMVLESTIPFPGYHGTTIPDQMEPALLFAITEINYNDERIIRCIQAVKTQIDTDFDAAPGTVKYQNKEHNFVRFKKLHYYDVGKVLDTFVKNGINFKKARKISSYNTLIKVRKFFHLKETIEGVYEDMLEPENSYLMLPADLTWNQFEKFTMKIKYNLDDKIFDAAQASVYGKEGMIDFVRIYDKNSCQGKLLLLRSKYLEMIERM